MYPNPPAPTQVYFVDPKEVLTGYVMGKSASDIEERSARSLATLGIPFTFQARISPAAGLTEQKLNLIGEVEVDLLAEYKNRLYPINVQGEIAHFYAAWQRDKDALKKLKIDAALKPYNAHELILVPFTKLTDQESSDRFYRYGFANDWPQKYYEE